MRRMKAICLLFFLFIAPDAYSQDSWTYCFHDNTLTKRCYPTLVDAEKGARLLLGIEPEIKKVSSSIGTDGRIIFVYDGVDKAPTSYTTPIYYSPNYTLQAPCPGKSSVYAPCDSEQDIINDALNRYLPMADTLGGPPSIQLVGQHVGGAPDFTTGLVNNFKNLSHVVPSNPRELIITFPNTFSANIRINKESDFFCPAGYREADWITNRPYPVSGNRISGTWDDLCHGGRSLVYITGRATQTASCPANNDPCYPVTGDKARFETDFEFSGISFVRTYHSLGQSSLNELAPNWHHTFGERLFLNGWYGPTGIDSSGYLEAYELDSSGTYNSTTTVGRSVKSATAGWIMTDSDGTRRDFDQNGFLIKISNYGDTNRDVSLQYDARNRISQLTDSQGRSAIFEYTADSDTGRLQRISLPDGSHVIYGRDISGNLTSVTKPDLSVRTYHYNETGLAPLGQSHLLTGITDERQQRYASFGYDTRARISSSRLHTSSGFVASTSLAYGSFGDVNVQTDGKSDRTYVVNFSGLPKPEAITSGSTSFLFSYNGNRLTKTTDRLGVITDIEYSGPYVSSRNEADGTPYERRITFEYTPEGRLTSATRFGLQNNAMVATSKTEWTYNARNQIQSTSLINLPSSDRRTTTYSYCEQNGLEENLCSRIGQLRHMDGPRVDTNDITAFEYYSSDAPSCSTEPTTCPHRKGDLWKVTNAAGHVTEYMSYDGAGRVLRMKDTNGVVTDMEYNARGWLTANKVRGLEDAGEFYDDAITRIEYDPTGQVTRVTQPDGYLLGDYIDFTYDAAHRLTGIRDAMGNSITYTLDNAGNRTAETTKDPNGVVMRSLNRVFDTLGRLQASKNAADQTVVATTYDANDNIDISTDGLGRVSDQDVDPLNRLIKTIQDQGAGKINATTQFEYDARDNLTRVVDPKDLATTYDYNGLNDLTELSSPDTGNTTYTYDQAGNRKTQTDARNIVTTYSYDALNRLTQAAYPTASLNSQFTYDAINPICGPTESFAKGRLTQFSDPSGSTQYCYDRFGNMTRKQTFNNGVSSTFVFAYTRAGRLSSLTYPSGMRVSYPRNKLGQVIEVVVTQGTTSKIFANNITYYPFGPLSRIEFLPPGSPNSNPYVVGPGAQLARSDAMHAAASGGGCTPRLGGGCNPVPATNPIVQTRVYDQDYAIQSVGGLNYQVDRLGNIESIVDSAGGNTFAYDHMDRLTNVRNSNTAADVSVFTYDPTGNRLTRQDAAAAPKVYAYPTGSHRLGDVAGVSRLFDANGNTRQIGTNQFFTYDERNRMVDFRSSSSTIVRMYQYNAKGERVRKYKTAMTHASYLYDESGKLLSETKTNLIGNTVTQDIIWLDDMPIGLSQNGALHGILTDHLNTPRQVFLTSTQAVQWRWDLVDNAFGEKPAVASGVDLDLRFPGQLYDGESGLHYNYFRDYEPGVGRYAESDPIGLEGGLSTYGYVEGNPLLFSDPRGLIKWTGEMYALVGGAAGAGGVYNFDLKSDCIDGKYAYLHVFASGIGIGGGAKFTGGGGPVEFNDGNSLIDTSVFNGKFQIFSAGAGVILVGGYSFIELGDAISTPSSWTPSPSVGVDYSAVALIGASSAWGIEIKDCSCKL